MKKILISFLSLILFTGCDSDGHIQKRNYLRSLSVDGDNITMVFFNDDTLNFNSDISSAKYIAEKLTGNEIFTGHTELIILGDCDKKNILTFMIEKWKVSPDCIIIFGNENILSEKNTDDITGMIKIKEKNHEIPKADIISTLSRILN
ncbi:MAG: hypothetical protein IKS03_09160 [Ruminococcus sp.]|nr:hypothetical protein [Ruminococcus sp.]